MRDHLTKRLYRHTAIVVGSYTIISILWILFSDQLVTSLFDSDFQTTAQTYKGIFFVLATAVFLSLLIGSKNLSIKTLFKRLQQKMRTFRDTFEQAAVGIAHLTTDQQWIRVNHKLCNMLGYSREEFKELTLSDIVHPDDLERGKEKDQQLISGDLKNYVMKKRFITKNNEPFYAKITKSAIYNGKEKPDYLVAIIEDVSKEHIATEKLKKSVQQKELLLREIHHRVKNNLAIISGLFELQAYNTDDDRVKQLLRDSMMRVKSMALIHESFYQSEQTAYVSFENYMQDFVDYIVTALELEENGITINLQSEAIKLNINQAIPLGLLINELVINAYVHAFDGQEEGTIDLIINKSNNFVTLKVVDSGKGLPTNFDLDDSTSLRATIIKTLAMQIDAHFELQSQNGTQWAISFQKEEKKGSSSSMPSKDLI